MENEGKDEEIKAECVIDLWSSTGKLSHSLACGHLAVKQNMQVGISNRQPLGVQKGSVFVFLSQQGRENRERDQTQILTLSCLKSAKAPSAYFCLLRSCFLLS